MKYLIILLSVFVAGSIATHRDVGPVRGSTARARKPELKSHPIRKDPKSHPINLNKETQSAKVKISMPGPGYASGTPGSGIWIDSAVPPNQIGKLEVTGPEPEGVMHSDARRGSTKASAYGRSATVGFQLRPGMRAEMQKRVDGRDHTPVRYQGTPEQEHFMMSAESRNAMGAKVRGKVNGIATETYASAVQR